jgi:protein MpaA
MRGVSRDEPVSPDGQALYTRAAALASRIPGAAPAGFSVEGRPIWGVPLGVVGRAPRMAAPPAGPTGPAVGGGAARPSSPPRVLLLVGGVHGDEPSSTGALLDLVDRLAPPPAGAGSPAPVGAAVSLWVIPVLNPDGLVRNRKNNARDIDLNRNFPALSFTRAHAPGYDPGPAPLSEPESGALAELIDRERFAGVVAVHAPFACVNYDGPARAWACAVSQACGWPVEESIGYPTPGSLGSWLGVDSGMPILTLELPPGTLTTFRAAAAAALEAAMNAAARLLPGDDAVEDEPSDD